jgi:hypothetical protein
VRLLAPKLFLCNKMALLGFSLRAAVTDFDLFFL